MNEKYATKLRGTDKSNFRKLQYRCHSDLQSDCSSSGTSYTSKQLENQNYPIPKLVPEPNRKTCGGRGIAIAQISQTCMTSNFKNLTIQNSKQEYSNTCIEQHFKKLKEENIKKIKEDNEDIWKQMLNTKSKR